MGCGCHGPCHWRPSSLILELQRCARSTGEPDTTGATNEWVSDVLTLRFLLLKPSSSWKELKFWLLRGHDYSSHKNCFILSSHGHIKCMQKDLLHNGFGRNLAGMTLHPFQLNLKQNNKSELIYIYIYLYGYGSIPINTIFRGMNIHLPAILRFTRGTRFWPIPIYIYATG